MQHRTEDTMVWEYSNTGTKAHAFLRVTADGRRAAACRTSITRNANARFAMRGVFGAAVCGSCVKLHNAYLDRVAASMEPATEAQDLGHVHVETEQPVTTEERVIEMMRANNDRYTWGGPAYVESHMVTSETCAKLARQGKARLIEHGTWLLTEPTSAATEAAEPVLSNESDIRKYLAGMDKDALTNLLAGTEQAAAESAEGQTLHTWVREEMDKRITYVQAPELMQRIRDLAPVVTDYELPGSLVDAVYEGTVVAQGAELIEPKWGYVTVRATPDGHRAQAALLDKIVRTTAARHQAARYGRWAHSL